MRLRPSSAIVVSLIMLVAGLGTGRVGAEVPMRPGFVIRKVAPGPAAAVDVAIGASGTPLVAAVSADTGGVQLALCLDHVCDAADLRTISTEPSTAVAVVRGADDAPVVAHRTVSGTLVVVKCADPSCRSVYASRLAERTGHSLAMVVSADGTISVAYASDAGSVHVSSCEDLLCSAHRDAVIAPGAGGDTRVAMMVGIDGRPLVAYLQLDVDTIRLAHCASTRCDAVRTDREIFDPAGLPALERTAPELGLDYQGRPLISWATTDGAYLAGCDRPSCSGPLVFRRAGRGLPSLIAGGRAQPLVIAHDAADVVAFACGLGACGDEPVTTMVVPGYAAPGVGLATTTGMDGLPLIALVARGDRSVQLIHCSNIFCVPFTEY